MKNLGLTMIGTGEDMHIGEEENKDDILFWPNLILNHYD